MTPEQHAEAEMDGLRTHIAALQARVAELEAERSESGEYVAWLCFRNTSGRVTIRVCDSDTPGAFRVYRRHTASGVAALNMAKQAILRISDRAPGYDWNSDPDYLTLLVGNACDAIDAAIKERP